MDETQITIKAYNANAHAFADKFMEHSPYTAQVLEFAKHLAAGDSVLDIGCGPGNVAKQLLIAKSLHITGIDLSDEMVKLACKNAPLATFFRQDIREAAFPESSFNAVILSFSIVHLKDAETYRLLDKAFLWLRNKGFLYLSFMEGKQAGFEQTSFSKEPIYFNYYNSAEIEQYLITHGFSIVRSIRQDYAEPNGDITTDVFVFGQVEKSMVVKAVVK